MRAQTPPGTVISNTAYVDHLLGGTTITVQSNAADTVVAASSDSTAPTISSSSITPSSVTNGGATVVFNLSVFDSSGIASVLADLRLLGKSDSTTFTAISGDTLWRLSVVIDSTAMGDTYQLPVTVIDAAGNSTRIFVTLVVTDLTEPFVEIISLGWDIKNDMRVSGNAVTLSVGHSDEFKSVFFEYRTESNPVWAPCGIGTWSDPNPDTAGPLWGILWNMDMLANGLYHVRATAVKTTGETDPSPKMLRLWKDSSDSWVNEWSDTALGIHVRRHRYTRLTNDTVVVVEGTMFMMDWKAFETTDTLWIRLTIYRDGSPMMPPEPAASSGLTIPGDGYYRKFEREDGQSLFDDWVWMEIPYPENGLGVSESDLGIYRYDPALGQWIQEPGAVVDEVRNVVRVSVRHFTEFAVFGAAAAQNLSNVLIYPNPFIPYDGDPNTGQAFVRGDNTTGIIFKNVTSTVEIDIYTIAGRKISTIRSTNTGGNLQWDAKTDDNREVASGTYVAVIRSGSGERVVKKFMVIR